MPCSSNATNPVVRPLFKFGTKSTGFTTEQYGPFECGHCIYSDRIGNSYKICTNPEVADDPQVIKDSYGNPIISFGTCCNDYFPIDLEKIAMLQKAHEANKSTDELSVFCPLVKVDVAKREVWGVVTAESPDRDNEVCDYETTAPYYKELVAEMSKATDGGNIFPLRVMHGLIAAGKGVGIEFRDDAKEIYMGFKVVDDNEWKKVQENVYTGFSQGGRYMKRWADGDFTRYTAKPVEVSLVDVPCLARATFDFIRADGKIEVRKFAVPNVPLQERSNIDAFKYLINKDGKNFIPYAKADGKINYRLMLKAWGQLHSGFKGKLYDGDGKSSAIKKLKQLYAQQAVDNPTEKSVIIDSQIDLMLKDILNTHAYGSLGKGMYTVSRFASIVEDIRYLWLSLEYEREEEGDKSPATDDLKEVFASLLDALVSYTEEQVEEYRSTLAAR